MLKSNQLEYAFRLTPVEKVCCWGLALVTMTICGLWFYYELTLYNSFSIFALMGVFPGGAASGFMLAVFFLGMGRPDSYTIE